MPSAVFVAILVASLVGRIQSKTFLNADRLQEERMNTSTVRDSLLLELKHAVTHGAGEKKLARLEAYLSPMYAALPKNEHGFLADAAVSYALHRFFVQRHGWHVKGLEPGAGSRSNPSAASILKDRVPSYMQRMVEQQLGERGFGLHDLAILAASLEHLVHDDAIARLQSVFAVHDLPLTTRVSEALVDQAIDTYMVVYIQGSNLTGMTPKKLQARQERLSKKDPSWRETRVWMRDVRRSVSYAARDRTNPFAEAGLDFGAAAHVVEEIGEQFGRWQDLECRCLKNVLVELDRDGTGRVALADFYRGTLDGLAPKQFEFTESKEFLRQNGALDESNPQQPRILIANYVNSPTNCLTTTSFYSVCCIDECEGLLGHLERAIGAPMAAPEEILELVAAMPSDTVEAPRNLSISLLLRLSEVAARHGGLVPLHSRLFAQWMHHAYPRECPFPHVTGRGAVTPDAWMSKGDRHASEEERRLFVEAVHVPADASLGQGQLMWTEEEELFAEQFGFVPRDLLRSFLRCAVLAAVLVSVALHLAGILSSSEAPVFPPFEQDCKCV